MKILKHITKILSLAGLLAMFLAPVSYALTLDFSVATTDQEAAQGDVQDTDCANLDESMAAAMGCDSTDQITDFTQYTGTLEGPDAAGYDEALTQNTNAREFIQTVVNYALSFLGLVAVVIIIYGGVMYVMSRGDDSMTEKGKKSITYAAVGIVIILASYAIVNTLIGIGGGDTSGNGNGVATNGTTITEAGAAFDVDGVLREIENITVEYKEAYETYIYTMQEVAYLQSIEMPLIVDVEEGPSTVQQIGDWITGAVTNSITYVTGGETTDIHDDDASEIENYTLISEQQIDAYISDLRKGLQNIQAKVDPYSETYERSQALYDYLRSGTQANENTTLKWIGALILPKANAISLEDLVDSYINGVYDGSTCGEKAGDSMSSGEYKGWSWEFDSDFGRSVYTTSVSQIDDDICPMISDIGVAAGKDYTETVTALSARMDELRMLFDTENLNSVQDSTLVTVTTALDDAKSSIDASLISINANTVRSIVNSMNSLHELVASIEFVKVRLTASTVEGNAPLIVRFDALGTEDPSGLTIPSGNIQWDLDGDGNFNSNQFTTSSAESGAITPLNMEPKGNAVSITYTDPGTYRARVRVLSDNPEIAAGLATVTIIVNPQRASIVLKATIGSDQLTVANDSVAPPVDNTTIKLTTEEAKVGPIFDAKESKDGNGNQLYSALWYFGDGEETSGNMDSIGSIQHPYLEEGTYNAYLKVTDDTGVTDTKYFKVVVGDLAARMSYSPISGPIGTEFTFDGSASSSDITNIASYQWSATCDGSALALQNKTSSTLKVTLEKPGVCTFTLTVANADGKTDSTSVNITVASTPPVAIFNYSSVSDNEPATIYFDAGDSYDPDTGDTITYEWDFDGEPKTDYKIIEGDAKSKEVTVQYLKKDDYNVVLTVSDQYTNVLKKTDKAIALISIKSVLNVDLEVQGTGARHLDENGEAQVEFSGQSNTATSLEIAYGDGETDFSDTLTRDGTIFTHTYKKSGIFYVTLTAFDDETAESISVTRRVYVGAGNMPIAVMNVSSDGTDIGFGSTLKGSINTRFTFSAEDSVNVDGTPNNLVYSWNFGDGIVSSQKSVTHTFSEQATYTVTLTVKDTNNSAVSSQTSVQVQIANILPRIRGITVVPQSTTMETPIKINVSIDTFDEDGKVTYVKAWYYDMNNTAEELGTVISESTDFTLTINTNGEQGDEKEYGFAAEVTDNNNQTVSSFDELSTSEIPVLTVVNGKNESPLASFTVDKTSVYVGEEVTFSSTSYDPDGEIVSYWWDTEGDGFYNNDSKDTSSYVYTFNQVHRDGVQVKLKVEDSSGATAESSPITIYVDSIAVAPDAAFLTNVDGKTVTFKNNSIFDIENGSELSGIYWDFDLNTDSNGNGIKDDDTDSFEENPTHTYNVMGIYKVKMTVVDNAGQSDQVTLDVNVTETIAPIASFTYKVDDKKVSFTNTSTVDTVNGVDFRSFTWDFDTSTSTDLSSQIENPSFEYDNYGTYTVKFTVVDTVGKTSTVTKEVEAKNPITPVTAYLTSVPQENSLGQIVLSTDGQSITFYFNGEGGSEDYAYTLDKNIFYDTDKDGIRDNDKDYTADSAGKWETTFYKSYGQTVVKLTVTDSDTGESDVDTLQVVFQGSPGSASLFNVTPSEFLLLISGALLAVIAGISMIFHYKPLNLR